MKEERISTRIAFTAEYNKAVKEKADRWVPACGGHEEIFTHNGQNWLYVWNPAQSRHGYLNLNTDIVQAMEPWRF